MTGSLYAGKGRKNYYVILNIKDINGENKQQWVNTGIPIAGNNKRKAEQAFKKILHDYEEKEKLGLAHQPDILFSDFMEQWLEKMKSQVETSTYESYRFPINHIVNYFKGKGIKLIDLKPDHIQKYYTDKLNEGLSAATIARHHSNIHKALDGALRSNIILFNPADRVDLPKKQKFQASAYSGEQIKKLLECVNGSPIESAVYITAYLGLRRSEVLGLKWGAIDLENQTLLIKTTVVRINTIIEKDTTKNKSSHRTLPIPKNLYKYLVALKNKQEEDKKLFGDCYNTNDFVCKNIDGTPVSPISLSKMFSNLLSRNGLPHIRFHDLRHSCASLLINSGCEIYAIKELLGHSQIATTVDIYGHMDFKVKQKMASKMDAILAANELVSNKLAEH